MALKWLLNSTSESANRRLQRWKIILSEFEYDIIYRKGRLHQNADAFSRLNPISGLENMSEIKDNTDYG